MVTPPQISCRKEPWTAERMLLVVFLGVAALLTTLLILLPSQPHYALLAESFLEGKLYFSVTPPLDGYDATFLNGRYYWPFPPFPAILLLPFVVVFHPFGIVFPQGIVQFAIVIATAFIVFRVARRFLFSRDDSLFFTLAFLAGSMYLAVAALSFYSYFAHVIAVFGLWAALFERSGKRRWWLIGVCLAITFLSRFTAGISALFFLGDVLFSATESWRTRLRHVSQILIPLGIAVVLLLSYNYLRFQNPLEVGYTFQTTMNRMLVAARAEGIFSLKHIPGNAYRAFLAPPLMVTESSDSPVLAPPFVEPDPWGMSIFVTSPYLLALFFLRYRERWQKIAWVTVAIMTLVIFCYFGIGWFQFGYRYALDILPLLFMLFLSAYRTNVGALTHGMRWLVIAGSAANIYLFTLFITLFR